MNVSDLLLDAFGRVRESAHDAVEGLTPEQLCVRPDPDANSIAWLVWHLARVQDDHIADVARNKQAWTEGGWADRFALPFDVNAIGYGQSSEEVGHLHADADLLLGYLDAVHERTCDFVRELVSSDLDLIVDTRWDPPVTLGVRLVSVISDDLQHVGQAAYVRGIVERANPSAIGTGSQ